MSKMKLRTLPPSKQSTGGQQALTPSGSAPSQPASFEASYISGVFEACRLANRPELAERFIAKRISLDAIRKALINAQAEEDEAKTIVGTAPQETPQVSAPKRTLDEDAIFAARRQHMTGPVHENESRS